jgi:hypothetical protein
MWTLLAMCCHAAAATTPVYVMIDRESWLYTTPSESARRLRVAEAPSGPKYVPSPVVVLERISVQGEFVKVRSVPMAPRESSDGMLELPSEVQGSWPHCYAPPPGIAQVEFNAWVRAEDLLSVTTHRVRVDKEDGSYIVLDRGVALYGGREGRYRAVTPNLKISVSLPDDAVGRAYDAGHAGRLLAVSYVAGNEEARYRVDPLWTARVAGAGASTSLVVEPLEKGDEAPELGGRVLKIADRCAIVGLSDEVEGVPERVPPSAEERIRLPIRVPADTPVTWEDGEILGYIREGQPPLWARYMCVVDPERGTCCSPPPGLELAVGEMSTEDDEESSVALCYAADMPDFRTMRSLRRVHRDTQAALIEKFADPERHRILTGTVTWSDPKVFGSLATTDIHGMLQSQLMNMRACYSELLREERMAGGELEVRFGVAADGYPRGVRIVSSTIGDDEMARCIGNRLSRVMVPNQIGMDPSTVMVSLLFRPPALAE